MLTITLTIASNDEMHFNLIFFVFLLRWGMGGWILVRVHWKIVHCRNRDKLRQQWALRPLRLRFFSLRFAL